jgi:hypothetical protein
MSNRGPVAFTVGSNYTELTIAYFDAGWPTIYCSIDESQQLGRNRFSPKKLLLCPASVAVLRCIALLVLQSLCSPQEQWGPRWWNVGTWWWRARHQSKGPDLRRLLTLQARHVAVEAAHIYSVGTECVCLPTWHPRSCLGARRNSHYRCCNQTAQMLQSDRRNTSYYVAPRKCRHGERTSCSAGRPYALPPRALSPGASPGASVSGG